MFSLGAIKTERFTHFYLFLDNPASERCCFNYCCHSDDEAYFFPDTQGKRFMVTNLLTSKV